MKYIKTDWSVPYYNMALEDYMMSEDKFDDNYVFFYIHDPSVIVGKHQNTIAELNNKYVADNHIYIARRISGGGAVYHDRGNLNFSFVFRRKENELIDFKKYTLPVIRALHALGINSELSGRNDILINGKKFSGNAQYMNKTKILHHGTLMFDVNIENLVNALNVSNMKIESKAIDSVRSRVANLQDYLKSPMTIEEFKEYLIRSFYEDMDFEEYTLTDEDIEQIEKRVKEKFSTWEHNYGASPDFAIIKKKKYDAGIIEIHLNVSGGIIKDIKIYGDFFFAGDIDKLQEDLKGITYKEEDVKDRLKSIDFNNTIINFTEDHFIDLLFYE